MFKLFAWILCVLITTKAVAQEDYRIDEKSQKRSVCGLSFAKVPGLVINVVKISESALKNRIDNERYNACPYWVTLNYQGLKLKIDFANDYLLNEVRNFEGGNEAELNFGVFKYDKDGWHDRSGVYENVKEPIVVKDSEHSIFVVGNGVRKGAIPGSLENCIGVLVVGNDVYAGGGICKTKCSVLAPLQSILSGEPLMFFKK
jgi:hypothetical protein